MQSKRVSGTSSLSLRRNLERQAFLPQNNPINPRALHAMPAIRSQVALFVGDPVNAREKLELTELFALMPKTIRTIPTASNARLIADFLFIFVSSFIHVHFLGGYAKVQARNQRTIFSISAPSRSSVIRVGEYRRTTPWESSPAKVGVAETP